MRIIYIFLTLCLFLNTAMTTIARAGNNEIGVVATIAPVQSLVAAIMQGVATPHLIIKGAGNPHSYNLRPSDAEALSKSNVIFWIGPYLENFLEDALINLSPNADIITLSDSPNLILLPNRGVKSQEDASHDDKDHDDKDHDDKDHDDKDHDDHYHAHDRDEADMHIWLSTINAKAMASSINDALIKADPKNKKIYIKNYKHLISKLDILGDEIKAQLASVGSVSFMTFHDSFQYFEGQFKLNHAGTISLNPNVQIGAKKLAQLRKDISTNPPACILSAPQYNNRIIATLTDGLDIEEVVVDPLGANIPAGPELYFELMRHNANHFYKCLQP